MWACVRAPEVALAPAAVRGDGGGLRAARPGGRAAVPARLVPGGLRLLPGGGPARAARGAGGRAFLAVRSARELWFI